MGAFKRKRTLPRGLCYKKHIYAAGWNRQTIFFVAQGGLIMHVRQAVESSASKKIS